MTFSERMRQLMAERGISLRALAREANYDPGHLSKIANGQPASAAVAATLDQVLNAGGELIRLQEDQASHPKLEVVRQRLDQELTADSASTATLDDWEQIAIRHGRATRDRPAPVLLGDLADDLAELQGAMRRYRASSSTRRLARVTAQMCGLMCLTLCKLDDRPAFRRWARTARVAAAESGDPLTESWVLAQEAYGYFYSGQHREAIGVSQDAQQVGARRGVGAALAAALEARAYAALGPDQGQAVYAALGRAENILADLDGESLTASAFGYTEAQLRFHAGSALTLLGQTRDALHAQERALALAPSADYTDRTLTRLDRAACLVHDGDASGGLAEAIDSLQSLTNHQRKGIIDQRGRELLNVLPASQRAIAGARDLRELLELKKDT